LISKKLFLTKLTPNLQFTTLLILVGTNPLPCYVSLKYYLIKNQNLRNVYLICSEKNSENNQAGTDKFAENIKELANSEIVKIVRIKNSENYNNIVSILNKELKISVFEDVMLDFTGGTKVMGIATNKFLNSIKVNTLLSYLSSKSFKLIGENGDFLTDDLRNEISITLEQLITLHNFRWKNAPHDQKENDYKEHNNHYFDLFSEANNIFTDLIKTNSLNEYYKSYSRKNFEYDADSFNKEASKLKDKDEDPVKEAARQEGKNKSLIKKTTHLKNIWQELIISGKLLEVNNCLNEECKLFDSKGSLKENLPDNKVVEKVIEYFDGDWLEHYIFNIILTSIVDEKIKLYFNCNIEKMPLENNERQKLWDFQLDLALIKGYELTGVSVTSANQKDLCKSKGFEVFLRTKQIGGHEAKAILITRLSDENKRVLENELQMEIGLDSKRLIVLGENDLTKESIIESINQILL